MILILVRQLVILKGTYSLPLFYTYKALRELGLKKWVVFTMFLS